MNPNETVELHDLVIMNYGSMFGKLPYRVTKDFLHFRLENLDNGFTHEKTFDSLDEIEQFIIENNHQHISLS